MVPVGAGLTGGATQDAVGGEGHVRAQDRPGAHRDHDPLIGHIGTAGDPHQEVPESVQTWRSVDKRSSTVALGLAGGCEPWRDLRRDQQQPGRRRRSIRDEIQRSSLSMPIARGAGYLLSMMPMYQMWAGPCTPGSKVWQLTIQVRCSRSAF